MNWRRNTLIGVALLLASLPSTTCAAKPPPSADRPSKVSVKQYASGIEGVRLERLSYSNDYDGTHPLYVFVAYPETARNLPAIVCMHGYSETAGRYVASHKARASDDWFVIVPEMRGRGGSAGEHDSGGIEILDIYYAVQAITHHYADKVDARCIGIQGWSGGGGSTSAAMVKLPDTFNVGASFYGMSNYQTWQEILDRTNPGYPGPATRLKAKVRDAPDRFLARQTNLAARNNPYSRILLFNDEEEPTCLPVMDRLYKSNADKAGLKNVTLTVSGPGDRNRFMHGKSYHRDEIDPLFLDPLEDGTFGPVEIADQGTFLVLGFVMTRKFAIFCGSGEDAVANVLYEIDVDRVRFKCIAVSSDPGKPVTIWLPVERFERVDSATVDGQPCLLRRRGKNHVIVAPDLNSTIEVKANVKRPFVKRQS